MGTKMKHPNFSEMICVDFNVFKDGIKISDEMAEAVFAADKTPIEKCRDFREAMAEMRRKIGQNY